MKKFLTILVFGLLVGSAKAFELTDLFIDVDSLPDDGYGTFQIFFLTVVYGFVLFLAANLISDGSEFLLLIPSISGMVGSIVLPVLGAVPDAAIVIFSGLGSDAQYQLEVGIGALAGSTILLLTIPWFLIITAGRVDIKEDGTCNYKTPKNKDDVYGIFSTGVPVSSKAKASAIIMLVTSISYLIIEGAAITFRNVNADDGLASDEYSYAIGATSIGLFFFVAYLTYAYIDSFGPDAQQLRDNYLIQGLKEGKISLVGVVGGVLNDCAKEPEHGEETSLVVKNDAEATTRLKAILRPSFEKYDTDKSGKLDEQEITILLHDLGEELRPSAVKKFFKDADLDKSGAIDFDEYIALCITYTKNHPEMVKAIEAEKDKVKEVELAETGTSEKEEEEEDGEEIPEDLVSLSPEEQQKWIWFRAIWRMLLGTILVVLFSDPMVDCFTAIGDRLGIRPFYVAFVLAPIASNASEIVASFKYASKKTSGSMTISMAALLGAAIMNNTLVFSVMMIVIATQSLYYQYFAETLAILLVELAMGIYVLAKNNHVVFDSFLIFSLYPVSIVVVYFLYYIGWG